MKFGKILIAGAALAAFTTPAMAMTFNWSFDDSAGGHPDWFVTGTISGLSEGANNAWGLTVTVDSMPGSEALGPFLYNDAFGHFTVTDGQITDAAAYVDINNNNAIIFTTGGHSSYTPQMLNFTNPSFDEFNILWYYASNGVTQFSRGEDPAPAPVPEPATWAMMVGGFGLAGAAMRRRKVALSFG